MRGILIECVGEVLHTGNDLDLVQEKKTIGKPDVQSYTAKVPGRNGLLNLTKALTGKVAYDNRDLSFQYFGTGSRGRLLQLDALFSRFHGQTMKLVDDDFPEHYYEGEAKVSTVIHSNYITITLTVDAQPFRLKRTPTVYSRDLTGSTFTAYLYNESIEAVPTITVTDETSITLNGATAHISAGTYIAENFALQAGLNALEITGTGTITIEYQEGAI